MPNQNQGGSPRPSGQNNKANGANAKPKKKRVVTDATIDQSTKPHGQTVSGVTGQGGYSRAQAYEKENVARDPEQRSTRPIAPENSALADELRSRLKGKPTRAAHERHWYMEVFHGVMDILKTALVILLCGYVAGN